MNLNINKVSLFPTNIYECSIDEKYCDILVELVNQEKDSWKKNLKNVKALTTGWNGLRYPIVEEISNFACSKILPAIGDAQGWKYNNWFTKEAWINFYQKEDHANVHTHFFNDYCAVLIAKEGKGNLKFCNLVRMIKASRPFEILHDEQINEKKGSFIFFPSWLYHFVSGVDSDRITVAFNFVNDPIET